ncbi:hypothetical protein MPL3356_300009 [Mesorhizobium plurifarium]|uniref:Uncharacterized protein n=1 Tax=Mesorhizobium plurifarium TaxID=69974 RepID=A0A090DS01_MESPL|nr:hypothetical protein MPL3356_300009 [Mesorhizobium plurifarium]
MKYKDYQQRLTVKLLTVKLTLDRFVFHNFLWGHVNRHCT